MKTRINTVTGRCMPLLRQPFSNPLWASHNKIWRKRLRDYRRRYGTHQKRALIVDSCDSRLCRRQHLTRWIATVWLAVIIGASLPDAAASDYPPAGKNSTNDGRLVWLGTCESCHAYGIAGAPNPMKANDWSERVSKPRPLLYDHAIAGFFGPGDTYMPPRGGNDELSDDEVKAAVDYMIEFALRTIQSQEQKP
ncbi:MAG: cytochrome c5 family protein [Granulosicoccus sp.]